MRGGAQDNQRIAKEDAAQALIMDAAKCEEMLLMSQTQTLSPRQGSNGENGATHALAGSDVESASGRTRMLEVPWSSSSVTESEDDRSPVSKKSKKQRMSRGSRQRGGKADKPAA